MQKGVAMALSAPQHPRTAASQPDADRFAPVAAGGPIADLQRTLEQRLLAAERPMAPHDAEGGLAAEVSRIAGPALLAVAYVSVALWWF